MKTLEGSKKPLVYKDRSENSKMNNENQISATPPQESTENTFHINEFYVN
jgi:hypothetical protein